MSDKTTAAVHRLLQRLYDQCAGDEYAADFPQKRARAAKTTEFVPTLAKGKLRPITPMLLARFQFAGEWENAFICMTWLSLANMKRALRDETIQAQLAVRREYWDGCVLAEYEPNQLSLLAIDTVDQSECYLVWAKGGKEPRVAWYADQHEHHFANFKQYLEFLLK